MTRTAPLYLRLPSDLKEQVDRQAEISEESLTVAVAHLVEVGLRNTDEQIAGLHQRIAALESEVEEVRGDRDAVRAELGAIREEAERNRVIIDSVLRRLRLPVGACPSCHAPVTGQQVFVDGACAKGHNLQASVLSPPSGSTMNQSDLLAALAVVGVALGVAVLVSKI